MPQKPAQPRISPAGNQAPAFSLVAEDVLPGHPDRLADAVAESIVDAALAHDPQALAGVEVGVHRQVVFVTGRVASGRPGDPVVLDLVPLVHEVYRRAGYSGPWRLAPRVEADLDAGPLPDGERAIRKYSDDQNIVTGYACASPAHLPPAVFAARRLKEGLTELGARHPEVFGPDGKVLVRLSASSDPRGGKAAFRWEQVNVALHHSPGAGSEQLHRLVLARLAAAADDLEGALPGLGRTWKAAVLRLNGAGEFSCGGPHGDNGLSGKKLAVDFYGPGVPIGGGAMCGKDPHKVDRIGALRARQLAVRLLEATGAGETLVTLGWLPGREEAYLAGALVDGHPWDESRLRRALPIPDLSIEMSYLELELAGVNWNRTTRYGAFGSAAAWES